MEKARPFTPQSVSEELVPVHPVDTLSKLRGVIFETVTAAIGVTTVDLSTTPANKYRYMISVDCSHNDPIGRLGIFIMLHPATGNGAALTDRTSMANGERKSIPRPNIIPQNHTIRAALDAIAAGQQLTIRAFFLELDHAQFPPSL